MKPELPTAERRATLEYEERLNLGWMVHQPKSHKATKLPRLPNMCYVEVDFVMGSACGNL